MSQAITGTFRSSRHALDDSRNQPASNAEMPQGYLQISLARDGALQVRGTRSLMDWFINTLASDGWCVAFEDVRWCG